MPLKTKQVGRYTVSQFGTLESVRARLFTEQIEPLKAKGEALTDDQKAMNTWLDEWAGIAACVTPFISRDEYRELDLDVYVGLIEAFSEVTGDMSGLPIKLSKKKKPSAPKNSLSASAT